MPFSVYVLVSTNTGVLQLEQEGSILALRLVFVFDYAHNGMRDMKVLFQRNGKAAYGLNHGLRENQDETTGIDFNGQECGRFPIESVHESELEPSGWFCGTREMYQIDKLSSVNWGMWGFPEILCDFYIALDVVCSTSSIFNLVAISIDRYYAVTAPIKYSQHRDNHTRAYIFIMVCWVASIAIGSPIMLGANHIPDEAKVFSREIPDQSSEWSSNQTDINEGIRPNDLGSNSSSVRWDAGNRALLNISVNDALPTSKIKTNQSQIQSMEFVCAFYNPDFIIWSSLGSFYIPCFVMIFLYARIFKASAAQTRCEACFLVVT
ncbi:hypothetical protein TCAL_16688 [Tigriopus californicus]|uniref:G-protein coupled receptors family 1 profile domain-containing protein n=1 Tax=Tigriopus californicus TaxID=6832 RepID=A0A553PKH1_TIGCA|nr:hypothetical protein TCAL_16688 [Tigriopus californicus]